MILGNGESGGSGTYNLSGSGSLSANYEYIGYSGSGTFTQSGGTNTVSQPLPGLPAGSSGTYNLQGGSLQAATVNINSGGVINQTGGSLNATTSLTNGGAYTMAGGTLSGATLTNNATFSGYGTINSTAGFSNYRHHDPHRRRQHGERRLYQPCRPASSTSPMTRPPSTAT